MKTIYPDTVQFGVSVYSGERTVRYAACPYCAGEIHRYPRIAWPHGYRSYGKCVDCGGFGMWEHEESDAILTRLGAQRQLTTISGYFTHYPEPPDDSICPYCQTAPCVALCEPPADEREYVRQFQSGAFDADLFYVGYERLLEGAE